MNEKMTAEEAKKWIHDNWEVLVTNHRLAEVITKYLKVYTPQVIKAEKAKNEEIKSGAWIKEGSIDEEAASTFAGNL